MTCWLMGSRLTLGVSIVSFCVCLHLLGLANAVDDVFYVIDIHGFHSTRLQLVEQFSYAFLNVVGNLVASLFALEIVAQGLHVVEKQFVSVFVNIEESTA